MNALARILKSAESVFSALNTPWALLGGWAVSVRTKPRFTRDVDLAVAVGSDAQAELVIGEFRSRGYGITMLVEQDAVHRLATARLASSKVEKGVLLDLLFASSGIEAEICAQAERLEIMPGLVLPVAKAEHLLALKILARNDRTRPQDAGDIRQLLQIMDESGISAAREALRLITERGYDRGRNLISALRDAQALFQNPA